MDWLLNLGAMILSATNAVWLSRLVRKNELMYGFLGFLFGPIPVVYLILVLQKELEEGRSIAIRKN